MSSTPPPRRTAPTLHFPGHGGRVGHRLHPAVIAISIGVIILIAAAVTATIVFTGNSNQPELAPMPPNNHVTTTGGITIADGISITPTPGWKLAEQGPDFVTLYDAKNASRMQVTIKTASGTDAATVLQANVNQLTSTASTGLTNVVTLGGVTTKTLQSENFQQKASINYTAQVSTQQGTIPVLGIFELLLNTSDHLSAFIDFRQGGGSTLQAISDEGTMVNSMLGQPTPGH